jgi:hypothetical protein
VATLHYPIADVRDGFARPLVWHAATESAP